MKVSHRLEAPLATGACAALVLVLCLLPLLTLTWEGVTSRGGLGAMAGTLQAGRTWRLLSETLGLGIGTTVIALAIGLPMGVLLGRTNTAGWRVALFVHGFPFFLPPFLVVLGWFHLVVTVQGAGSPLAGWFFGPVGVMVTLGLQFAPVVTGLTVLGLGGVDPALEEAARLVAGPWRVVGRILLPLAWPAIAFSSVLVFVLAVSDIGVPMFLRVKTYPAAVFTRLGGITFAPGEALALVLPLLALASVLILLDRRGIGRRSFATLRIPSGTVPRFPLGRVRPLLSAAVWAVCLLSVAPIGALVVAATPEGLAAFRPWVGRSLINSVEAALAAATVITVIGIVAGHGLARGWRTATVIDAVASMAFVTPAAVLGVGIVATWNTGPTQFVYASMGVLVVGLSARYLIVGVRTVAAVASRTSPDYDDAAAAFGAGYFRRLFRIFLPMHARGVVAAWLFAVVFCLRDLETVIIFYPPGLETLPIRIFTLEANGPPPVVAALSVAHVGLTAGVLLLGTMLLRAGRWP